MADSGLLVTISGAALSVLFYENACSVGDQMGFLLGDVVMYVTKNVTDSERHEESVRRHIEITGVLTVPSSGSLYDASGKLYRHVLKECVRERSKEIVGWFRYRPLNRLVPTFRDKILHKELAAYFQECNGNAPKEHFLACILNASTSEKKSTHKFRHVLLRYDSGVYHPVPLRINNLGGGTDRPDTSDYMPTPARTHEHEPDVFTKFLSSLNLDLDRKSGSELVMTIQRASEYHLSSLIPMLCESDREVYALEKQVREIRTNITKKVLSPKNLETFERVSSAEKLATESQQANETNRRVSMHMEGEQRVKMQINPEKMSPPRTPNVYEDSCVNKDSTTIKVKSEGKPHNTINANAKRNPSNSVQRSPSERISYSQAAKKAVDAEEDLITASDC